jgi:electron transfer flavoprotein beta subunit
MGVPAHVPVQLAETLGLDQMLGDCPHRPQIFDSTRAVLMWRMRTTVATYEMEMPCVLSVTRQSGYKLPYVTLTDMRRDVSDELVIITSQDLGFSETEVGPAGSRTKVVNRYPRTYEKRTGISWEMMTQASLTCSIF